MAEHEWVEEFKGAVIVTDENGTILEMNERAIKNLKDDGGRALLGTNVLDCHPEPSKTKLKEIMAERRTNVYTIEKRGVKKLIFQAPWTRDGRYRGLIEVSLEIPFEMPHFVRKS
ncbi:MAG: PAS domain-containing protein [Candidatus Aminicenantes bacterium]|nr:PAS domain-containing protein [Candidatus Aminicenantes bacterium]